MNVVQITACYYNDAKLDPRAPGYAYILDQNTGCAWPNHVTFEEKIFIKYLEKEENLF